MKQILQDLSSGETNIVDCPVPKIMSGSVVIKTKTSLISVGTEKMLLEFGKASYINKAKQQPEKVKEVLNKIQSEGLISTFDAVRTKLSSPIPLGYSNVGVIDEVSDDVYDLKKGDRVISNGPHAEYVSVKKNLCVPIPDSVDNESASFTVVASIALQGVRLAVPTIGESFVVIGAGLIGLLTIQILKANGCRVLAVDIDKNKLKLAETFGAEIVDSSSENDFISKANSFSKGRGVDGVLITASSKSNDIIKQSANISRKRGRIVLVGVVGMELNRSDFYEKELSFQVSCSYGPGRYDPFYEEDGNDYPIGFVRWTERRNFEAVLDMMNSKSLNCKPLISHHFKFSDAPDAYSLLSSDSLVLGIILNYESEQRSKNKTKVTIQENINFTSSKPIIGFIGAGNYASRILMPAFKKNHAQLHTVLSAGGVSGLVHGKRMGFYQTSTNIDDILNNEIINTVVIATKHDSHSKLVVDCLNAKKNVWVEKPLCIYKEEIKEIKEVFLNSQSCNNPPKLMVGFNRRFSPHVKIAKEMLESRSEPLSIIMTINAGQLPNDHWLNDVDIGGGRLIGEGCHFFDLIRFIVGQEIINVDLIRMDDYDLAGSGKDKFSASLKFHDGSIGTIHYFSNGSSKLPKERIEVYSSGRVIQIDNFRKMHSYGFRNFKKLNLWKQDKGQLNSVKEFCNSIENGTESPIPFSEIIEVSEKIFEANDFLK